MRVLDALAFLVPDIQGGVGPFLIVFMSAELHWEADRVGQVMFVSALVGLLLQAPAGALVDHVRSKPLWIAAALGVITLSVLAMALFPTYPVILLGQSAMGGAGTLIAPAIAAVSLGLVGRGGMEARIGRNIALTAAGTVVWALCTGLIGHFLGPRSMFAYAIVMGIPAIAAALSIRNRDIDPALARGADREDGNDGAGNSQADRRPHEPAARWHDRRLTVLCTCTFLFHLANAALLTLVAQEVARQTGDRAPLYLSASLIVTQLVTVGIGLAVGRFAAKLPRKPIFLLAFVALPIRALLYLGTRDPALLVSLQLLDGIGTGVSGVMIILIVGDLTQGSGRFNLGQGIIATVVGAGAAFSNLLAGTIVRAAGYDAGFITLGIIAAAALGLFVAAMPETRSRHSVPAAGAA